LVVCWLILLFSTCRMVGYLAGRITI